MNYAFNVNQTVIKFNHLQWYFKMDLNYDLDLHSCPEVLEWRDVNELQITFFDKKYIYLHIFNINKSHKMDLDR